MLEVQGHVCHLCRSLEILLFACFRRERSWACVQHDRSTSVQDHKDSACLPAVSMSKVVSVSMAVSSRDPEVFDRQQICWASSKEQNWNWNYSVFVEPLMQGTNTSLHPVLACMRCQMLIACWWNKWWQLQSVCSMITLKTPCQGLNCGACNAGMAGGRVLWCSGNSQSLSWWSSCTWSVAMGYNCWWVKCSKAKCYHVHEGIRRSKTNRVLYCNQRPMPRGKATCKWGWSSYHLEMLAEWQRREKINRTCVQQDWHGDSTHIWGYWFPSRLGTSLFLVQKSCRMRDTNLVCQNAADSSRFWLHSAHRLLDGRDGQCPKGQSMYGPHQLTVCGGSASCNVCRGCCYQSVNYCEYHTQNAKGLNQRKIDFTFALPPWLPTWIFPVWLLLQASM